METVEFLPGTTRKEEDLQPPSKISSAEIGTHQIDSESRVQITESSSSLPLLPAEWVPPQHHHAINQSSRQQESNLLPVTFKTQFKICSSPLNCTKLTFCLNSKHTLHFIAITPHHGAPIFIPKTHRLTGILHMWTRPFNHLDIHPTTNANRTVPTTRRQQLNLIFNLHLIVWRVRVESRGLSGCRVWWRRWWRWRWCSPIQSNIYVKYTVTRHTTAMRIWSAMCTW